MFLIQHVMNTGKIWSSHVTSETSVWLPTLWSNDFFLLFCPPRWWLRDTISHAIIQFAFPPEQIHISSPISNKYGRFLFWERRIQLFYPQKVRIAGNNTWFPNKTSNSATHSLNFDPVSFSPQSKHSNLNYLALLEDMWNLATQCSLRIKLLQN